MINRIKANSTGVSRSCWLALLLTWCAQPAMAQVTLRVLTDNNPPLAFQDDRGTFRGLAVDILLRAVEGTSVNIEFEQLPWPRAYARGLKDPNTCLIGIGRTAEREPKFRWVGPFVKGGISLFAMKQRHLKPGGMKEVMAQGHTVGIARDDVASVLLTRYPGILSEHIPRQTLAPKMLESGRFDLWASGRILGEYRLMEAGVDAEEVLRVDDTEVSMGCTLETDAQVVAKVQAGLVQITARKITSEIERSYLNRIPLPARK